MESGAGRHWTEEEVKALLSVWSEKNIRKQLHGTLRNKGIFIYIAKRLQELGICRDWKQCRAKYKNLKYEYRTVKYAHNSGDATKTMKFFHELDAILQHKPVTQLTEEENRRCSANDIINATKENNEGEVSVTLEEEEDAPTNPLLFISHCRPIELGNTYLCLSPILPDAGNPTAVLDASKNLPFIPSVANEGGKHWTVNEVRALIRVWSEKSIQQQLEGTVRNKRIFEHVAARLQKFGIDRDWKQCRTKYKNLKHEYKSVKDAQYSGNISKSMKFFRELDAILGHNADKTSRSHNDHNEKPTEWIKTTLEKKLRVIRSTAERDNSGHSEKPNSTHRRESIKEEIIDSVIPEDNNSINMIPDFSHIKQEPIDIDDDSISTISEDTSGFSVYKPVPGTDNQMTLDEAQNHFRVITVNDTGAGKHWCDNEVRALINIWSDEEIQKMLEGATRNKEIFEEIARRLMKVGIDRDWKQCRTKYKNLKYEYRAVQKENNQLGSASRKMRFYEEIDCILRNQPSEMFTEVITDTIPLRVKRKASEEEPSPIQFKKSTSENTTMQSQRCVSEGLQSVIKNRTTLLERFYKQEEMQDVRRKPLDTVLPPTQQASRAAAPLAAMAPIHSELKLGKKINEGKTKEVYELPTYPGCVLLQSKDQITAGNAARKNIMEGKAAISNTTTACVFQLLQESGIKTAFVRKHSDTAFIAAHCEMIPIEWVCRRIATGSFLKRNPGVEEGYKFYPPKIEMFYKDDAANDPQWSEEQLIEVKFKLAGLEIGQTEVDIMAQSTRAIFEILEKAWQPQNCTLVDLKVEFGVNVATKEIVLADVIDNDSWRLWPSGDRKQQKDKQSYRDLKEVTPEALQMVKRNFEWVAERVELLLKPQSQGRVVVLMGSTSDLGHCEKIKKACGSYGVPCELRVTSAHKGPDETLRIKAEYEGDGIPTVFVAVAGRSNGLGPVMSGNTAYPVVNCPPLSADWGAQDIWSSLRMPSGLGCSTILSPEGAAQFAAQIFGLNDHCVWAKLRSNMLNTWISLKQADKKMREYTL
ncbi:bifunctional phosphoribosylaminoimidazole carboxylase/phosphoribosylaminoimidazole succinocarboxamide synthetase isoform 3-T3 [Liasis olivaceus]